MYARLPKTLHLHHRRCHISLIENHTGQANYPTITHSTDCLTSIIFRALGMKTKVFAQSWGHLSRQGTLSIGRFDLSSLGPVKGRKVSMLLATRVLLLFLLLMLDNCITDQGPPLINELFGAIK